LGFGRGVGAGGGDGAGAGTGFSLGPEAGVGLGFGRAGADRWVVALEEPLAVWETGIVSRWPDMETACEIGVARAARTGWAGETR
jgi:hypothetical protein